MERAHEYHTPEHGSCVVMSRPDAGLIPQWRAANDNSASIRLGLRLGFVELGRQLSVKVLNNQA